MSDRKIYPGDWIVYIDDAGERIGPYQMESEEEIECVRGWFWDSLEVISEEEAKEMRRVNGV